MDKRVKKNIIKVSIIIISLLFIGITLIVFSINGYLNLSENLDTNKLGHFGDFIGGVLGTLLTILATILIYLTYTKQSEELELSRELFSKQNFENTFFNMLKIHQDIKNNLSFNTEKLIIRNYTTDFVMVHGQKNIEKGFNVKGREIFIIISEDFKRLFRHFPHDNPDYYISKEIDKDLENNGLGISFEERTYRDDIKEIQFKYNLFFKNYASYLGDYFRNLYHILKFISGNKKSELKNASGNSTKKQVEIKYKQYSDILQSQMNFSELQLTYYNSFKFRKLRKLIKEFDFIENLHSSNLLSEYHINFKSLGKIKTN